MVYTLNKPIVKTYIFKDSEQLTQAVNCLFKNRSTRQCKSHLYIMNKKYYLMIFSHRNKATEIIGEFSDKISTSSIYLSVLNEYAKPLIKNKAIYVYGKAFSKYF